MAVNSSEACFPMVWPASHWCGLLPIGVACLPIGVACFPLLECWLINPNNLAGHGMHTWCHMSCLAWHKAGYIPPAKAHKPMLRPFAQHPHTGLHHRRPPLTAVMAQRKRVLISNDDGINAPGLLALVQALVVDGLYDVCVCGPADEQVTNASVAVHPLCTAFETGPLRRDCQVAVSFLCSA